MLLVKPSRTYGHYCGVAHALDLVGERWALLVVRELLVGPRRFTDLCRGLPGIGTNVLTARLKELERSGVVHRRRLPRPAATTVYELTDYGRELEDIVLDLGRWGAKSMGARLTEEHFTATSLALAMQANFRPESAKGVRIACEFRFGDETFNTTIEESGGNFRDGPSDKPDIVIEADPDAMIALLGGAVTLEEASNGVSLDGRPSDVAKMIEVFSFPSRTEAEQSETA